MHQLDLLVAEPLRERHVLIRHRDEAGLDHRLVGVVPVEPGQLLVLATPGAHEVPSLVDELPALLESFLDDVESVWVGIGSLAASAPSVSELESSLRVGVVAPDGGVAAMPGAALYAGHGVGGTGWYRSGDFLGARFPLPEWESWVPNAPVDVDGMVATPVPCGLVIAGAHAFDVPVNQRFPKLVVGSPVPAPSAVAALLAGLPDRPIMVVPAAPEAGTHIWQAELAMRLSRDVVFSAGTQVRTRNGALSTVVPDADGKRHYRPFPLVLQQPARGGDQQVLDIAAAPPGWEREGRRSYRHAGGAVVADVVPSGLALRAADGSSADPAAEAAPFDPAGWTLTVGKSGQGAGLPVLAAAEELLAALPAQQRAMVRVRMAGVMDAEAEHAVDRWADLRKRTSVSSEDSSSPWPGFVVAPPEPDDLGIEARLGGPAATEPGSRADGMSVGMSVPVPPVPVASSNGPGGSRPGGLSAPLPVAGVGGPVGSPPARPWRPAFPPPAPVGGVSGPAGPGSGRPMPPAGAGGPSMPVPSPPVPDAGGSVGSRPDGPWVPGPVPPVPGGGVSGQGSAAGVSRRFEQADSRRGEPGPLGGNGHAVPPVVTTSGAPVSTVSGPPTPARQPERVEPTPAAPAETALPPVVEPVGADALPIVGPEVMPESVPEPRAPGRALVVPGRASTAGEQARFTAAAGETFTEALATVNAAMATWPSMRVDDSFGAKADYVAVCLFLGRGDAGARSVNGALRGGQGGVLDGQVPCLMSGILRLPTHRRAVLRQGKVNESLEHGTTPGTVLTEPGFLAGSIDLDVTVPGADLDVLIWPSSARRTSELVLGRPIDEAVFVAGSRFKALAVRTAEEDDEETEDDGTPMAPRIAVLYRELAPGETPTTTELDERDLVVLAKLDSVLARRHQGSLRLIDDPEVVARLTTSMVAWQQEAAAAVAS